MWLRRIRHRLPEGYTSVSPTATRTATPNTVRDATTSERTVQLRRLRLLTPKRAEIGSSRLSPRRIRARNAFRRLVTAQTEHWCEKLCGKISIPVLRGRVMHLPLPVLCLSPGMNKLMNMLTRHRSGLRPQVAATVNMTVNMHSRIDPVLPNCLMQKNQPWGSSTAAWTSTCSTLQPGRNGLDLRVLAVGEQRLSVRP